MIRQDLVNLLQINLFCQLVVIVEIELFREERKMKNQSINDEIAAIAVAGMLFFTALDNAPIMLISAVIALAAVLLVFKKSISRAGTLSAIAGFTLAIGISIAMLMS